MSADKKDPFDIDDDDGVIYDLSTGKKLEPPKKSLKNKKKYFDINSNYAVFYIIAILIAIILAVVLFMVALDRMRDRASDVMSDIQINMESDDGDYDDPLVSAGEEETAAFLGVIQHINSASRVLTIYDINNENSYILNVSGSTDLRDRFGQGLVFAEFSLGDIVVASFTSSNNTLTSLQISNNTWERRLVDGLEINQENNTIVLGATTFNYTSELQILNNGNPYSINNLSPLSVVNMRGINNTVWFIDVERGFGSISIINSNQIIDGSVEISRSVSLPIGTASDSSVQEIDMPEGSHRIVVRGSNIAPYTHEVVISNAETTIVDLSEVPLTSGTLSITTNIPTATVSIDGSEVDFSEPITLNFGQFTVTATAAGYETFESVVTINSATHQLPITLTEEVINTNVEIRSIPAGADVFIDNSFVGITPVTAVVPRGDRSLTLRREGYQTVTMNIDAGSTTIPYLLELQPVIQLPPPLPTEDVNTIPPAEDATTILPESPTAPTPPIPPTEPPILDDLSLDSDDISFIPGPLTP